MRACEDKRVLDVLIFIYLVLLYLSGRRGGSAEVEVAARQRVKAARTAKERLSEPLRSVRTGSLYYSPANSAPRVTPPQRVKKDCESFAERGAVASAAR